MEKIRRFFNNLNEKRSYQIVFFIVSMCVVLGMYASFHVKISNDKQYSYTVSTESNIINCVEDAEIDNGKLKISGWCFYRYAESKYNLVQVFLRNLDNEEETVWLDVEQVSRKDVDDYYDCEFEYDHVGFEAETKLRNLSLDTNDYEIFIKLTYTMEIKSNVSNAVSYEQYVKTVSTNRYFSKGKLTALNPKVAKEPVRTASDRLNEVLANGQLMEYGQEYDMYIYQYEDKIYWVAGENYRFDEEDSTYIQFQLYTTRSDKLPQHRLEGQWYFDNLGFIFEKEELVSEETFPYRVAVCDLPRDYPITYFETGVYENSKWLWRENIVPMISWLK